jgi:hypothetical protein
MWNAYVDRMFEQRPLDPRWGSTDARARGWLTWLARTLYERNQTEFHLDRLTPEWVPGVIWKQCVWFSVSVVAALVVALSAFLAFGLAFGWVWGLGGGLVLGLAGGLDGLLNRHHITPIEKVRWSWSKLRAGAVVGAMVGLAGGLAVWLVAGPSSGVAFSLGAWLGIGLIGGMASSLDDSRAEPNEGIRRSMRRAIIVGLFGGLAAGVMGVLAAAMFGVQRGGLVSGFGAGMSGGLAGGLATGVMTGMATGISACSQHYAVRAALVVTRSAPWRYGAFLEAMAEHLLLRRSGSSYQFVHRLLRDHLASLDLASAQAKYGASTRR